MQLTPLVADAAAETARVVAGVKLDQLAAPTPCRDWDVRTLGNHLLQVVAALELAGRGQPVPGDLWGRELITEDWTSRFGDEASRAAATWEHPAGDGTVQMGGSSMPAALVGAMLASDLVIHGWDLARATQQPYRCDAEVATLTQMFIADTAEQGRQMGIFAEPVAVGSGASTLDQALAMSGRDPDWAPPA